MWQLLHIQNRDLIIMKIVDLKLIIRNFLKRGYHHTEIIINESTGISYGLIRKGSDTRHHCYEETTCVDNGYIGKLHCLLMQLAYKSDNNENSVSIALDNKMDDGPLSIKGKCNILVDDYWFLITFNLKLTKNNPIMVMNLIKDARHPKAIVYRKSAPCR
jgi:hypothetical protein